MTIDRKNCEPEAGTAVDDIDLPEVVSDVTAMVERYEAALVSNDMDTLDSLFWKSAHTIRYGVTECLYGYDDILRFRKGRSPKGLSRTVMRRVITAFGSDVATACQEFVREGERRIGRQTQTWVRFAHGWRVVEAHVSWMDASRPAA